MKKQRTRVSDVKVMIDFGEYYNGYAFQVSIGNALLSADIKYPTKPTAKQIRKLKKAWFHEMRTYDFKSLFKKRYCIKTGRFIALKRWW